jgi:hypothetical protein
MEAPVAFIRVRLNVSLPSEAASSRRETETVRLVPSPAAQVSVTPIAV